ncbi:MAG: sigma-54-dependent Fis family transcriptional regulator, partial [Desulfobacterales bacterium]|nr:sigma-54-dependent Fis family transcriptional regulator [Desulfobacterales bacterium]
MADKDRFPGEFLVGRADEHPLMKHMLKPLGRPKKSSTTAVRLSIEKDWVGCVSLYADGWNRFNEDHLRLLSLLKAPFAAALSNSRRYEELRRLKELLADDNRYFQEELRRMKGEEIIGADFGLKGVLEMARQVAPLNSPVLILGETGAGKEVIAGAIHNMSPRREGPLIKVNCGAIPETLLDSELFGHEKGAFTGA